MYNINDNITNQNWRGSIVLSDRITVRITDIKPILGNNSLGIAVDNAPLSSFQFRRIPGFAQAHVLHLTGNIKPQELLQLLRVIHNFVSKNVAKRKSFEVVVGCPNIGMSLGPTLLLYICKLINPSLTCEFITKNYNIDFDWLKELETMQINQLGISKLKFEGGYLKGANIDN